jgi:hypothetical protein
MNVVIKNSVNKNLEHSIYYLYHEKKVGMWETIITTGCFLATSKEQAWELYNQHVKKNDEFLTSYPINKESFLNNLDPDSYGSYKTLNSCIYHLKIEGMDERDEYSFIEYEYKKPKKNK